MTTVAERHLHVAIHRRLRGNVSGEDERQSVSRRLSRYACEVLFAPVSGTVESRSRSLGPAGTVRRHGGATHTGSADLVSSVLAAVLMEVG
jgi:hypothetical protein